MNKKRPLRARKKTDRVSELWRTFRSDVMHPDCPPQQVEQMKIAFYAGMSAMFGKLVQLAEYQEDVAASKMDNIHSELNEFKDRFLDEGSVTDEPIDRNDP